MGFLDYCSFGEPWKLSQSPYRTSLASFIGGGTEVQRRDRIRISLYQIRLSLDIFLLYHSSWVFQPPIIEGSIRNLWGEGGGGGGFGI